MSNKNQEVYIVQANRFAIGAFERNAFRHKDLYLYQ